MLKIEGAERLGDSNGDEWGRGKTGDNDDEEEEEGEEEDHAREAMETDIDIESDAMRNLVAEFERKMDILRSVVAGNGTRVEGQEEADKLGTKQGTNDAES